MALTPVEIRHLHPPTGFIGYKRGHTDRLFDEIAESFEDVWRERADLADKIEQLETDLVRYKELESLEDVAPDGDDAEEAKPADDGQNTWPGEREAA